MRFLVGVALALTLSSVLASNSYIEFGQFDKVRQSWVAAGALYVCSKDESLDWPKRSAYQFLHFKLEEVVSDYFRTAYRLVAVRDFPVKDRTKIVDEHRKVELEQLTHEEAGIKAIGSKKLSCAEAGAFVTEAMKFNQ